MITIPFFGYEFESNLICAFLEEDFDIKVNKRLRLANQCLEKVTQEEFPLIIIDGRLCKGKSDLAPEIGVEDYEKISQYVISETRNSNLNRDTPIIAIATIIEGESEIGDYERAGANLVINRRTENINDIVSKVGDYLREIKL